MEWLTKILERVFGRASPDESRRLDFQVVTEKWESVAQLTAQRLDVAHQRLDRQDEKIDSLSVAVATCERERAQDLVRTQALETQVAALEGQVASLKARPESDP